MDYIKKQINEIKKNQNWQILNDLLESEFEKFYNKLNPEKRMVGLLNYKKILLRRLQSDIKEKIILKILMGENDYDINNEIRSLLAPLSSIAEMYHHYYNKEISKIENNKKVLELGKKLSGKQVSDDRLKAYKIIFEKDFQLVSNGGKRSFRTLCFNVAKNELGLTTEEEKESFYKSFNKFKKQNNITGLISFNNYLSTKGRLRL